MSLPAAVLTVVLFLAGIVAYVILVQRSFRRLRRVLVERGYKSPAALALISAAAFVGPLVLSAILISATGSEDVLWVALALYLIVPFAGSMAAHLLPAKSRRTAGPRAARFPYATAGYVSIGAAIGLVSTAVFIGEGRLISVATPFLLAGVACLVIARRLGMADASAVLGVDRRAPVLYLRPFEAEACVFVEVPRGRMQFLVDWGRNALRLNSRRFLTVEEYVAAEITRTIGPFVALGNPVDFAPPEGAARHYFADDEWMARFTDLVQRAACIITIASSSRHLAWELEQIRNMDLHPRLVVLTAPRLIDDARSLPARIARWWTTLVTKPRDKRMTPPISWNGFARTLKASGYDPGDVDPAIGAVVGFDDGGRAIVLVRGTASAAETVAAIRGRIG